MVVPKSSIVFTIHGQTTITAPATLIWSVLRDTAAYPSWNSFCPDVIINGQPSNIRNGEHKLLHKDTHFTFRVVMNSAKPNSKVDSAERVTDISTPEQPSSYVSEDTLKEDGSFESDLGRVWRIAWTTEGGFAARGLKAERFNEIIDLGDGRCEYRSWECQGGLLARTVKWFYEKTLQERFGTWCEDLKRECERRAKEEGG